MRDPSLTSLSAEQLDEFRAAILANVESLYLDARLLMENGRHARATSLAILAREELAKLLPVWVLRTVPGPIDIGTFDDLRDHGLKLLLANGMHALTLLALKQCDEAAVRRDWDAFVANATAENGAKRLSDELAKINALKQHGFYVSWSKAAPRAPVAPPTLFAESDSRPFVNILVNYLLFAYPCDAAVTMIASGVRSSDDVTPEAQARMAEDAAPHFERVLSYLKRPAAARDFSTPPA